MPQYGQSLDAAVAFFWRELGVVANAIDGGQVVPVRGEDGLFRWRSTPLPPGQPLRPIPAPAVQRGSGLDAEALMVFIRHGEDAFKKLKFVGEP